MRSRLELEAPPRPCNDPKLRDNLFYASFVKLLADRFLVDFALHVEETVGVFCVRKKNGTLRLIIDARRSNCWFTDPPDVSLATGTAISEVCMEEENEFYIGHLDIINAFYKLELPESLRRYFGLRPLRAGLLGITHLGGVPLKEDTLVFPRFAAVPMGWTHALVLCQQLHVHIVSYAGFGPLSRSVTDGSALSWATGTRGSI